MREAGQARLAVAWIALSAALTGGPYLAAWAAARPGWRYLWILPPYAPDSQAYMVWARQAYDGAWLFRDKLTAYPHDAFLFHPFFLALGRLAAVSGAGLGPTALALKTAGVVVFWLAFWRLARTLGFTFGQTAAATALAGACAGLGGLALLTLGVGGLHGCIPIDIWLIDANTLWAMAWNPLFPWSMALLLFYADAVDRASRDGSAAPAWAAGAALAGLLLVHPYAAPLALGLALALAALRRRAWFLAPTLACAAPVLAYLLWESSVNPLVRRHGDMGLMLTPSWAAVLLGLAPLLLLSASAPAPRDFAKRHAVLILWAAAALALARVPVWYQRKLLFGAQLPLALLAGSAVVERARVRGRPLVAWGLVAAALAASAPSWGYIAYNTRLSLSALDSGDYYARAQVLDALSFLGSVGSREDVVLSTPDDGTLVALFSGKTAVWGHWAQSVDYFEVDRWFGSLAKPGDPRAKARALWSRVGYVFASGGLKQQIDGGELGWLRTQSRLLYSNGEAAVYGPPQPGPSRPPSPGAPRPARS